jgi:hypothetical protein|tara:strand:- start:595 stop:1218 length:624 start_codon:yes stop_codon:yes gene_type:complete
MGYDVYGLNPKINHKVEIPTPPWDTTFKTNNDLPYKELSEEERKERDEVKEKYFSACRENEEKNKGVYFRNNVWWWRPLWNYVNNVCYFLTGEDYGGGGHNSGYIISKSKSLKISKVLEEELKSGRTKKYEEEYNNFIESLPLEECEICEGTGKRVKPPNRGKGDIHCNGCDGKGETENYLSHYPFDEENVREFLLFCKESGGFQIC